MIPTPTTVLQPGSGQFVAAVALFAGIFASVVIGGLLAVRMVRGYRRTGSTHLLALGIGLLLVVPLPQLVNIGLETYLNVTTAGINVSMALCRVGGLVAILSAIYPDRRLALVPPVAAVGLASSVGVVWGAPVAATALEALVTGVGLFVAYQAIRGYRRNDSRPMLFLAAGLGMTVSLHFLLDYPAPALGLVGPVGSEALKQVVDVVALLLIGSALVVPSRE